MKRFLAFLFLPVALRAANCVILTFQVTASPGETVLITQDAVGIVREGASARLQIAEAMLGQALPGEARPLRRVAVKRTGMVAFMPASLDR